MAAPHDSRLSRLASRTVAADSIYGARHPPYLISRQGSHPVSCRTGRSVCPYAHGLVRRSADVRICLLRSGRWAPVCLCTCLYIANLVGDHRAAFPIVLVGNQIADSVLSSGWRDRRGEPCRFAGYVSDTASESKPCTACRRYRQTLRRALHRRSAAFRDPPCDVRMNCPEESSRAFTPVTGSLVGGVVEVPVAVTSRVPERPRGVGVPGPTATTA